MLLALTIGAGLATWLVVAGLLGKDSNEQARREELLSRVRGDHPQNNVVGTRTAKRRSLFARGTAQEALRGARRGVPARIEPALIRAGISAQPREFIFTVLIAAATLGLGTSTFYGVTGGVGGFFLGIVGAWWVVRSRTKKRLGRLNDQLVDLLQVVAGGLSAGQSFLQAVASAAREIGDPIGSELRLLLSEVELGATMEGAFERLRDRVGDDDLSLVIDAVLIQRRVGGNLSEVLTNISWTIRERIRIRGEVAALTGQAKMSGWLLGGLPFALAAILTLINRDYMAPLYTTGMGHLILAGGLTSEAIGILVMRKIASVKA